MVFKKGDLVTYLADWDRKGTVYFRHGIVYSCGKKVMVLTDAETGEEMGRHFDPKTGADRSYSFWSSTVPRMTDEEATKTALERATEILEKERADLERLIESCGPAFENHNRCRVLRSELAKLHEPKALRYSEKRKDLLAGN